MGGRSERARRGCVTSNQTEIPGNLLLWVVRQDQQADVVTDRTSRKRQEEGKVVIVFSKVRNFL